MKSYFVSNMNFTACILNSKGFPTVWPSSWLKFVDTCLTVKAVHFTKYLPLLSQSKATIEFSGSEQLLCLHFNTWKFPARLLFFHVDIKMIDDSEHFIVATSMTSVNNMICAMNNTHQQRKRMDLRLNWQIDIVLTIYKNTS